MDQSVDKNGGVFCVLSWYGYQTLAGQPVQWLTGCAVTASYAATVSVVAVVCVCVCVCVCMCVCTVSVTQAHTWVVYQTPPSACLPYLRYTPPTHTHSYTHTHHHHHHVIRSPEHQMIMIWQHKLHACHMHWSSENSRCMQDRDLHSQTTSVLSSNYRVVCTYLNISPLAAWGASWYARVWPSLHWSTLLQNPSLTSHHVHAQVHVACFSTLQFCQQQLEAGNCLNISSTTLLYYDRGLPTSIAVHAAIARKPWSFSILPITAKHTT